MVAVTVMGMLLFVWDVIMLRVRERGKGGVVALSTMLECMGGTRSSCVVSSVDDVLEMREDGGVWVWLGRGAIGLRLNFANPVGRRGVFLSFG